METLEATETLPDDSSKKASETQTLEALGGPRLSELGFSPEEEPLAPAPGAEAKTPVSGLQPEAGEGEELHSFAVGDFVWGKIKSHPWWPGQVYDPSRASDHAKRAHRRDRSVLVAYFGDDTFAWCHPAQLRSFLLDFHQMVKQSSSRSFVSAVEDVVVEIGRCLELELTCHCVPPEVRPASARGQVGKAPVANFAPLEFLEHLRDVACDVSVVDMLEGAMLRGWVLAFGKGWTNGSAGYHRRRGVMDLVDKIDLDVPPGDLADSKEEEYWITGSSVVKGPKISTEKLFRNRKKRSMAKLIAEMDLDAVEVSDGEDEKVEEKVKEKVDSGKRKKKTENEKGSEMENVVVKGEEEGGSGRRERKKSKYLSPPYTYLSGYTKYVASPRSAEMKTPRKSIDSSGPLSPKSQTVLKCNCDTVQKEEDKMSPSFQVDSTSVHEILVEFLCTAVNPLRLKWNRLAKTIRGFFAIYRSSMYSSGSDCETYQKHLTESCGINSKTPVADRPELGKSEGKRKQKKDGTSGETTIVLGSDSANHSKQGKVGRKRRVRKDDTTVEPLVNLEPQIVDVPVEGKLSRRSRKGKDDANGESMVNLSQELLSPSEAAAKLGQKMVRRKGVANGKFPVELDHELSGRSQEGMSGHRRRKSKNAPNTLHVLDLDRAVANGPNEGKSGQKRRKKDGNNYGNPAALHMNFAPGITLPSRDDLISTFSKYGVLIESETELLQETASARVVFVKSTDAEKAFNGLDKTGVFGAPYATYRLRYLPALSSPPSSPIPVPKPPLPYIRKSLERMISSLAGSSTTVKETGCSDGLKPEARENLVGEMQGLLMKVNKMLNGPVAGTPS
ncbi:putative Serine/threonine-protein kinase ATM [Cocos nucifera]|uniref:Putative Serine/threonine-protein kinase ATM n=1 Tax=Cocos nucifera TaxID=13894 RepID=A0A8K0I967_COCNU|nr:putative Serine/threonine-protein kinase ATM [Cocos nucifera]